MSSTPDAYHEVLWISQEEMARLIHDHPDLEGFPGYLCVDRSGVVKFWPKFNPEKYTIMMTSRWGT